MTAEHHRETRALQAVVAILALVLVPAGLAGLIGGPAFLRTDAPWPTDLDSHTRFLSGVFFALAIGWYSCIPDIARKTARFRLLAVLVIAGGCGRLASLLAVGVPSAGHLMGLGLELVVVPLLVLWQARLARRARRKEGPWPT